MDQKTFCVINSPNGIALGVWTTRTLADKFIRDHLAKWGAEIFDVYKFSSVWRYDTSIGQYTITQIEVQGERE